MREFGRFALAGLVLVGLVSGVKVFGEPAEVVHTAEGAVKGEATGEAAVMTFKGIPYAAPPVGDLRWAPPLPAKAWTGVRAADKFGPSCMQREHGEALPWTMEYLDKNEISEDCLYLNVWTPKVSSRAKLPVVVFIHGGAFTEGSGAVPIYDGAHLAKTGLVVVTINYRLGVFGFFAHPELTAESPHHSSGNYALLDQLAALRWVKANIAGFGGDPKRITIWGQSAGAFSVGDLLVSPLGAGLFERAMADSGLGLSGRGAETLAAAEKDGVRFAEVHHATSLKELRTLPAAQLLSGPQEKGLHFGPIVDGWVIPRDPQAMNAGAEGNDVPVITGYQANDGLLFTEPVKSSTEYRERAQKQYGAMAAEFERLYPAGSPEEAQANLTESVRDRERVSMFLWASRRGRHHHAPVYTYFFDRGIPWPQHPEFGAFHSGELPYFFLNLNVLDRPWEAADYALATEASHYLTNFAEKGNPNGGALPLWPSVKATEPATMELGAKLGPMPLADKARVDFWERYFSSKEAANAPPF